MDKLLARLAHTASKASLGVALILTLTCIYSCLGIAVPSHEGSIVSRSILLQLGPPGAAAWAILLSAYLLPKRHIAIPGLVATIAAAFASLVLQSFFPLAAITLILFALVAARSRGEAIEAILLGVVTVEALSTYYVLCWAFSLRLPVPPILPLHLALYMPLTPLVPLLVFLSTVSPILALAIQKRASSRDAPSPGIPLVAPLALIIMTWLIIYHSPLNPGLRLVGVDPNTRYLPHAIQMQKQGPSSVLTLGHDRPLYYLFLYILTKLAGSLEAVKLLPLFSMLLYTLSTYLLARELWGKRQAELAAYLSAVSYTTTAGLYGGLYNNWAALALSILAYTSLAKWLKTRKPLQALAYLVLLAATLATHAYMGAVLIAATTLTQLLALVSPSSRKPALILLLLQAATALALGYIVLAYVKPGKTVPIATAIRLTADAWIRRTLSITPLSTAWWDDYITATINYVATAALDPTTWILTLIALSTTSPTSPEGIVLFPWMIVVATLSATAPSSFIYRALYDYPYPIAETLALAKINTKHPKHHKLLTAALLSFKTTYTLAYTTALAT
jgi:hypothetical protein